MKSVGQRRWELMRVIQKLQRELDILRQLGYGQSFANMHADSDRHLRPSDSMGGYNGKG